MPHAPLPSKVLFATRSLRPPAIVMPVPTSPGALSLVGVAPLLLLMTRLPVITQQMSSRCAPGGGDVFTLGEGQIPSCGGGGGARVWCSVAAPPPLVWVLA